MWYSNIFNGLVPSIDECTLDNGGCEHECVPASVTNSSTRTCRCNPGFELHEDDGVSCKGSVSYSYLV